MLKVIFTLIILINSLSFGAVKIRDEVEVESFRTNYLTGYGIVVGLSGTGDGTTSRYTLISIANMLRKLGIYIDPAQVRTKNAAAVIVTANLPPFAKPGMTFDVNVSSLGDAKDIGNGVLIRTPLYGPDGKIYAFAQGSVSTGGGFFESNKGGKVQRGFTTSGIIINGGMVEEELPFDFNSLEVVRLNLKNPDFKKATSISETINSKYGNVSKVLDPSTVLLQFPKGVDKPSFLAEILSLEISSDNIPTIVIHERTGTVILSGDIKIDPPVYVSHGNIYVMVESTPVVSQPQPFGQGQTVVTPQVQTKVVEEKGRIIPIESASVKDLVKALNDLGVSPRDLIAILQAIKSAGKIHAHIKVM
ncbi:MAG: flagellar basal body P-ring protein FlgI [Hydrogenothermaceae bacterium]|nr:flagellar basal body P-ring protein FlgI [Hydrogenothermaceae bacterium]